MKILVTCDSYKDCLSADQVGESIIQGLVTSCPKATIIHIPIADGGEGSLKAICNNSTLVEQRCKTYDPLLREMDAFYLTDLFTATAYIEMASSSGIELLSCDERNGYLTSTYGTGVMMADALSKGYKNILLFVGGSATSDMGIGMAAALGVKFFDSKDHLITYPKGCHLNEIKRFFIPSHLKKVKMKLVCDVENPLVGPDGASFVYGPQKGIDMKNIAKLDAGMKELNDKLASKFKVDYSRRPGAGAAGGIGAMCFYIFSTDMISGGDFMFERLEIEHYVRECDLIITGEGRMDKQTRYGKIISRLGALALKYHKKMIAVCGKVTVGKEDLQKMYVHKAYSLSEITDNAPYTPHSTRENLAAVGVDIGSNLE